MNIPLINRQALEAAMKGQGVPYAEVARLLGLSKTGLSFKTHGRKGRGLCPFTEEEVQILRSRFGDSILSPAPITERPEMMKRFHREAKQ